jgi:outer membrane immunogenic protein
MTLISKIALGALASVLLGGTAMAADLMAPPPVEAAMTSDWTGGYIGVEGNYFRFGTDNGVQLNAVAGANFQSGMFLVGLEGWLGYTDNLTTSFTQWNAGVEARAGLATEAALVYGGIGFEHYAGSGNEYWSAGVGVEFMLSDNMSLDLEYKHLMGTNNPATLDKVGASVLWHFK